jgi:hypothetical protein
MSDSEQSITSELSILSDEFELNIEYNSGKKTFFYQIKLLNQEVLGYVHHLSKLY